MDDFYSLTGEAMIQKIGSIKLTFFSLVLLIVLMGMGIVLSLFPAYTDAIEKMNQTIVYQWIVNTWHEQPLLTTWVLLVTISSAVLFINTACCSMTIQLRTALKTVSVRRWSFFIIHFLFLMVLACHGITMVTGHKQDNIQLCPEDSHLFGDNYRIDVVNVTFSDDPKFLTMKRKKSRHLMTRKNIHPKLNYADIALFQNNRRLDSQRVFMLHPMRYKSIRITVTRFIAKHQNGQQIVGVNLSITRNIFTQFFFTVYALMIITLACFVAITWKPKTQEL